MGVDTSAVVRLSNPARVHRSDRLDVRYRSRDSLSQCAPRPVVDSTDTNPGVLCWVLTRRAPFTGAGDGRLDSVDHQSVADRVASDRRARAAHRHRHRRRAGHVEDGEQLITVPRTHHRLRNESVQRGVRGVERPGQRRVVGVNHASAAQLGEQGRLCSLRLQPGIQPLPPARPPDVIAAPSDEPTPGATGRRPGQVR